MGVPRLFKYICDKYPDVNIEVRTGTCPDSFKNSIDNLYIDSNALIHRAAQITFNYGNFKTYLPRPFKRDYKEQIKNLFETFWEELILIIKTTPPTQVLYIAVDGCAPCAKQAQQRQRRYIAGKSRENNTSNNCSFDSCNISPGTIFMWELTKFIKYSIRKSFTSHPELFHSKLEVVFSPHNVPGEGEHKILDFIRNLKDSRELTHCMWGPDGDLLMLTLGTKCPNFFWLRENNWKRGYSSIVDIGKVREYITKEWFIRPSIHMKNDIINDFLLVGIFVGNDFLPKIAMFDLLEDGFEVMMDEYHKYLSSGNGNIHHNINHSSIIKGTMEPLTRDNDIVLTRFSDFIRKIAGREKELLINQLENSGRTDPRFINSTLIKASEETIFSSSEQDEPSQKTIKKVLNYEKYRKLYYEKMNISTEEEINKLCKDYLEGLYWIFYYYILGCPSWKWYYPYHYSPLFLDFSKYLEELVIAGSSTLPASSDIQARYIINWGNDITTEPFQQLLSILPPSSSNLLPREYRKTFKNTRLYPTEFNIDYEGKHREYEGIALLPFIEPEEMKKIYNKIKQKKKYRRNSYGSIGYFSCKPALNYTYKCDYGIIENCNIFSLYK